MFCLWLFAQNCISIKSDKLREKNEKIGYKILAAVVEKRLENYIFFSIETVRKFVTKFRWISIKVKLEIVPLTKEKKTSKHILCLLPACVISIAKSFNNHFLIFINTPKNIYTKLPWTHVRKQKSELSIILEYIFEFRPS
jgi:hypothetical protein